MNTHSMFLSDRPSFSKSRRNYLSKEYGPRNGREIWKQFHSFRPSCFFIGSTDGWGFKVTIFLILKNFQDYISRADSKVVQCRKKSFEIWHQGDGSFGESWRVRVPCMRYWSPIHPAEVWKRWKHEPRPYSRWSGARDSYRVNSQANHTKFPNRKVQERTAMSCFSTWVSETLEENIAKIHLYIPCRSCSIGRSGRSNQHFSRQSVCDASHPKLSCFSRYF